MYSDPFTNARVRWKGHCVLGEVTLRNFLWEEYDYVKEKSYAPPPPLLKIDIVLDNEHIYIPLHCLGCTKGSVQVKGLVNFS